MKFVRFVAGVACADAEEAEPKRMALAASRLCAAHAGEGADVVLLSREEYRFNDVELSEVAPEKLAAQPLDGAQFMTEEDKDVALDCLSLMLRCENAERSINAVLERFDQYYQADRVYILTLSDQGQTITMLNEWVDSGKHSIQQSISGKRTSHFPVIARYATTVKPVVLSMREAQGGAPEGGRKDISWQYAIFPMEKSAGAERLLCLENPRRNIERTALLERLLPYLALERGKAAGGEDTASPLDRLYALPTMQNYMDVAYSMDSDHCRSLGALAMDIPNFADLKERRGYEFGTRFLLRISEALSDVFGRARLFHTREAEFIVLCADVTYETFLNQCARAKQLVGRKYTGLFRLGCTWSDGIFRGADLVNKARSIMKCTTADPSALNLREEERDEKLLPDSGPWAGAPGNGRFTIYLQPKVDMRTGMVVGAEALLRVLDAKGNLMNHGRLIEAMESEGTISRADYFVFDKVLATLSRWKDEGRPLLPVSSNFSRKTLLNPTALASVLAILSRYPEVGLDMVELEITETVGNFENSTFAELIKRFSGYGLRFSLDDFGSSYSNISMLSDLQFHSVKLDRSMIRNVTANQVSRMLVHDIAQICDSCGMLCIAEGVETQAQAKSLLEQGCNYAQGYLFGRPMSIEAFEKEYFQA